MGASLSIYCAAGGSVRAVWGRALVEIPVVGRQVRSSIGGRELDGVGVVVVVE